MTQATAFQRRHRRRPEQVDDNVRFCPSDGRVERQLYVIESEVLAWASDHARDAILFARFYEKFGDRYGAPVREGITALVAAQPPTPAADLLERIRRRVEIIVANIDAGREADRPASFMVDAYLAWGLPGSTVLDDLTTALVEFREQHQAGDVAWLVRVGIVGHSHPKAPRSLTTLGA